MKRAFAIGLALSLALVFGCREPSVKGVADRAKQMEEYENRKILTPKNHPRPPLKSTSSGSKTPRTSRPADDGLDAINKAYEASHGGSRTSFGGSSSGGLSSGSYRGGRSEDVAVKKVVSAINASLELGPTLVIWVVDRTPTSQKIATEVVASAKKFYDGADVKQMSLGGDQKLLTTIVAFDETADFLLDPPASDCQKVKDAFDKIAMDAAAGREKIFTTLKATLDKYLSFRTQERREIVLAVITDEAGDDTNLVDELIETTRKAALPVYVIGSPAPWGQVNPNSPDPKKADLTKTDDSSPVHGPESFASERVDASMTKLTYGYNPKTDGSPDLIDSGFGPFALERLCRASGGQFLIVRPEVGSQYRYGGTSYTYWPNGTETRFTLENMSKYAPDYVSAAEYNRLLGENKARQALVEAAKLPKLVIDEFPTLRFPRNEKITEAKMKQALDRAQQYAAKYGPKVDPVFNALVIGESDREKLTSPRWQAEYDLAMGRVMAIKVRIDGYNSMIAALKRGKNFSNAGSTEWVLEPSDKFETESTLRKMGERAKMYLERVVKDHPGTPWAKLAEEELKSPLGWTWTEA